MKRGLTLIEAVVSLLILAIVLSGMMAVFSQGFSIAQRSKERSCAYNLALRTMEEYLDWQALVSLTGRNPPRNGQYPLSSILLNDINFLRQIEVRDGPVWGSELKEIIVVIRWPNESFNLQSYVANY